MGGVTGGGGGVWVGPVKTQAANLVRWLAETAIVGLDWTLDMDWHIMHAPSASPCSVVTLHGFCKKSFVKADQAIYSYVHNFMLIYSTSVSLEVHYI